MLQLDALKNTPLYLQLYEQIKGDILSGAMAEGTKLPSIRLLAKEMLTGKNTVESAYAQLVLEGYVQALPHSGFRVNPVQQYMHPVNASRHSGQEEVAVREEIPQAELKYDFHYGDLDASTFPYTVWRKLMGEVMKESSRGTPCSGGMHSYEKANGDITLRRELARYLYHSRGVRCEPERVVICSGLQPSILAVLRLLGEEARTVALEDPTYTGARVVYECFNFNIIPVPVKNDGIDLDVLAGSPAKLAHITPSHQFPTGVVMPVGRRMEILNWASKNSGWIIEDDYDSELRYHGRPIPSLQSIDKHDRVIYMGTFSKTLSPGMRMSYMVLPKQLAEEFKRVFAGFQCTVPWLEQAILARMMAEGHWERHLRKICLAKKKNMILL